MTRIKWVEVRTGLTIKNIPELLQAQKYSPGFNLSGFELLNIGRREVQAKFIQEFTLRDTQIDPFGREVSSTITRYSTTIFTILDVDGRKLMRVTQPPRSLRDLVLNVSAALGGDFFAQEIRLDVTTFLDFLRAKVELGKTRVRSAVFVDVPLTDSSTGRVLVESSYDAIHEFKKCLSGGKLDRVNLELVNEYGTSPLEITHRGSLIYSDWLSETALREFESHISSQLQKNGQAA